jgi:hypothetical protein
MGCVRFNVYPTSCFSRFPLAPPVFKEEHCLLIHAIVEYRIGCSSLTIKR